MHSFQLSIVLALGNNMTTFHKSSNRSSSPLSLFVIPPVFDAVYYTTPNPESVLVHAIPSGSDDEGFQAILCLHPEPNLPPHLGLPALTTYEEKAFLQVSVPGSSFVQQVHANRACSMQITVTEYLILLHFIESEWPRLHAKLESQLTTMREGTDPIYMTGYLTFYKHGSSHFRVSLSSRLSFVACIESTTSDSTIKAWLERRPLSDQNDYQEMVLPMQSLALLIQDAAGMKVLVEQMTAYKSRSRKRSKSVLS